MEYTLSIKYITIILLVGLAVGYILGNIFALNGKTKCEFKDTNNPMQEEVLGSTSRCSNPVDISGAVKTPGIYCLNDNILNEVVQFSGGFTTNYASKFVAQKINLAQKVEPFTKVYIPFQEDVVCTMAGEESCISVNIGTLDQLDSLPGIGPSMAQKIIEGRPYKSITDLKNISGIGNSTYEKIFDKLCL